MIQHTRDPDKQLASLDRDGALIHKAVDEAAAKEQALRPALEERRRALVEEIHRAERALDRYYRAFEDGDLDSGRFQTRVSADAPRRPARTGRRTRPTARHRGRHHGARQRRPRSRRRPARAHGH